MIEKIDSKYIKDVVNRANQRRAKPNNDLFYNSALKGDVFVKYKILSPAIEKKVVKEPVPFIGKIFPFIKRKVIKEVKTGKQEIVEKEEPLWYLKQQSQKDKNFVGIYESILEKIPFTRIIRLDEDIYGGELYLARYVKNDLLYAILTKDGIKIGEFNMYEKGYYSPDYNKLNLLPKEVSKHMDGFCEPVSLEESVFGYMYKNPDSIPYIPQFLYDKFFDLKDMIKEIEQNSSTNKISKKYDKDFLK